MSKLKVAIIAPPWLSIPPKGYGGIEEVLDGLISGLVKQNASVEVFTIGRNRFKSNVKIHTVYKTEQNEHIHRPMYEALPILATHVQFALNTIKADGKFDIIHDHNGFLGPLVLAWATHDKSIPPVVHTVHGPPFSNQQMLDQGLPDNRLLWQQIGSALNREYLVGVSDSLVKPAPKALKSHILGTVYNSVDVDKFRFVDKKKDYFLTLARFSQDKGQHVAAKLCNKLGYKLVMAGTVAGISSVRQMQFEIANPISTYRYTADFRYYSDKVLPFTIDSKNIKNIGNISGKRKLNVIANAKALLFPIDWEEPFGMAVIECLASGTPVVAMNRGAMPEIIEHGVNGFLANTEAEFAEYMQRVSEIDPRACRESVEAKFSSDVMAAAYIDRYKEVIRRASRR